MSAPKKKSNFKGILPERFKKHYDYITKPHRFDVKIVHVEFVEACSAAFDEAKREDLIKNEDGKKKKNKYKNRFRDVIPYDTTRVKLPKIEGDDNSDYINANWVHDMLYDGEQERRKAYISTQGPIRRVNMEYDQENVDTCPDFWRMVWENNVEVIVMLTKLSEDMREMEKCSRYWPEKVGETTEYLGIAVTLAEQEGKEENEEKGEKGDPILTRKFVLQRGEEKKEVTQLQYTGWPDHGVPDNEDEFIQLTEIVDKHNPNNQPLVVHCSAGIGRSGTFCAIHSYVRYLRRYYDEKKDLPDINVPQRLIELRKDRPKMIQTKEQYEFVYRAIYKVFGSLFDEFEEKLRKKEEGEK